MEPHIISLPCIGKEEEGFLTVVNPEDLPFPIKRVFWTCSTPVQVSRGRHAHHQSTMALIATKGSVNVFTISDNGKENYFNLSNFREALIIPPLCWHEMTYSADAVQLVLTDTAYLEKDYIRDKNEFLKIISK